MISGVGLQAQQATHGASVGQTVADSFEARRLSVSGVSIDEEMVSLIAQQRAFSAASRVVSVADEIIQDVLNMV